MNKWTKQYNNDTGPNDDYFEEWFEVTDGMRIFRCEESEDADFLLSALTQPEQEPVGQLLEDAFGRGQVMWFNKPKDESMLYTTPPQPEKPDQDEVDIRSRLYQRIHELETQLAQPERDYERGFIDGMQKQMKSSVDKAVNRLAQPEQEPVAYINIEERKLEWAYKYMSWDTPTVINLPKIPLYTTPPQRERVLFPTMLRKMWSGSEVQAWLDENVNKEKNT